MSDFDRVIKENIEAVFLPLLDKLFGLSIRNTFEIKDKVQRTVEREPDFLKRVIDYTGLEFILQLEFQTNNDPEMVYRMAEYKALLQRKYKLEVRQFVIYLGTRPVNMVTELQPRQQIRGFSLTNIHDLSIDNALNSEVPEEIILAILMDFRNADPVSIVRQIITKLRATASDETKLMRTIQQLLILSRLRNLQTITNKEIKNMPITYDITKDSLYLEGLEIGEEKGIEKGIEKGFEKGIEKGKQEGKDEVIVNALQLGVLTAEQIAEMVNVSGDYVTALQKRNSNK